MLHTLTMLLFLHGIFLLLLASLLGIPLGRSMASYKATAEQKESWRMAHAANTGYGVFLMAIAGMFDKILLSSFWLTLIAFSLIIAGYSFLVGTFLAAKLGYRGLKPKKPFANLFIYACYIVAVFTSLLGTVILFIGALKSF